MKSKSLWCGWSCLLVFLNNSCFLYLRYLCQTQDHYSFLLCFLFYGFIVLVLLRSRIHFKLIFVYGVEVHFFPPNGFPITPTQFIEKIINSLLHCPFVKNQFTLYVFVSLFLDSVFHFPNLSNWIQYNIVMITVALQYLWGLLR